MERTNRKNGAQHVYHQLKELLVNYRVAPGQHLQPSEFSRELKVSATPIRDAMHRLCGEHLLLFVPNRGFFTKVLDLTEMSEVLEIECVLLKHAITKTRSQFDAAFFSRLASRSIPGDAERACRAFEEFVRGIARQSGKKCLIDALSNSLDRTHFISLIDFDEPAERAEFMENASELVECLCSDRLSRAIEIIDERLRQKMARLPLLVKEGLALSHQFSVAWEDAIRLGSSEERPQVSVESRISRSCL